MLQHLPALVTLLNVLLLFGVVVPVGLARGRYGIKAPATSGHPAFERAYRVQMNTLENTVMFLPLLWLAARYGFPLWAGIAGLVWIGGRIGYAVGYLRAAEKRSAGYLVGMIAWAALLILATVGIVRAMAAG
jgi:uncharacterized MAPEG superfamily protein